MGWNRGVPQGSCSSKMGGTRADKTVTERGVCGLRLEDSPEVSMGMRSGMMETLLLSWTLQGHRWPCPQVHLSLLCFQYVNPLTVLPSLNSLMIFCYPQYKFQPLEFISSFSLSVSVHFRDTPPLLGSLLLPVYWWSFLYSWANAYSSSRSQFKCHFFWEVFSNP